MELSTGQNNLEKNQGGSSWQPGKYNSEMPPLLQPHPEDREEEEEDNGNVGSWNRAEQKARNSQPDDNSDIKNSEGKNEGKTSGQDSDGENKEGISSLINKGIGEAEDAAREATGEVLRQSWINLIETYGLTFLYINFHFTMSYLGGPLSRFFPKPGREWASKFIKGLPVPKEYKKNIEEGIGSSIEPWELALVTLANVAVIIAILAILFIGYVLITEPASLIYHAAVEAVKSTVE